jgi:predicted nucleotidyltransferase
LHGRADNCYTERVRTKVAELERSICGVLAARADVRFALLFGSAVAGGPRRPRDLDVALGFARSPSLMDLARLSDALEVAVGMPVDVVDVDAASTLLRWEIVRRGRMIHRADEAAAIEFLARVPLEWLDLEPYRMLEIDGLRRGLGGRRPRGATS